MHETWWEVLRHRNSPEPVQVIGSTAKFITLASTKWRSSHRAAKAGHWASYFKAEAEALWFMRDRILTMVSAADSAARRCEQELHDFDAKHGTIERPSAAGGN